MRSLREPARDGRIWDDLLEKIDLLASLYDAFPPEQTRRIVEKLEIHHTVGVSPDCPLRLGWLVEPGFVPIGSEVAATAKKRPKCSRVRSE